MLQPAKYVDKYYVSSCILNMFTTPPSKSLWGWMNFFIVCFAANDEDSHGLYDHQRPVVRKSTAGDQLQDFLDSRCVIFSEFIN